MRGAKRPCEQFLYLEFLIVLKRGYLTREDPYMYKAKSF